MPRDYRRDGKDMEYVTDHTTSIRVRAETRTRLKKMLYNDETYDKLLNRLMDDHEKTGKIVYHHMGEYVRGKTDAMLVTMKGRNTIYDTIEHTLEQYYIVLVFMKDGYKVTKRIPLRDCTCEYMAPLKRAEIEKLGLII